MCANSLFVEMGVVLGHASQLVHIMEDGLEQHSGRRFPQVKAYRQDFEGIAALVAPIDMPEHGDSQPDPRPPPGPGQHRPHPLARIRENLERCPNAASRNLTTCGRGESSTTYLLSLYLLSLRRPKQVVNGVIHPMRGWGGPCQSGFRPRAWLRIG